MPRLEDQEPILGFLGKYRTYAEFPKAPVYFDVLPRVGDLVTLRDKQQLYVHSVEWNFSLGKLFIYLTTPS